MFSAKPRGVIKTTPQSFVVQELVGPDASPVPLHESTALSGFSRRAPGTLFHLVKQDMTTHAAMAEVSAQLGIDRRQVSHHGLKDRRAVTAQCLVVHGDFHAKFSHPQIALRQVGDAQASLMRGKAAGNRFKIEVRTPLPRLTAAMLGPYVNLFGHQRFRAVQGHTIGRMLLEGNFKEAMALERQNLHHASEDPFLGCEHDPKAVFFGNRYRFETGFRIQQWQSHLWNELAKRSNDPSAVYPMWSPAAREQYRSLWNPKKVDPNAEALLHVFSRKATVEPKNVSVEKAKGGWRVRFDLPPGAYATVALANVFTVVEHEPHPFRRSA